MYNYESTTNAQDVPGHTHVTNQTVIRPVSYFTFSQLFCIVKENPQRGRIAVPESLSLPHRQAPAWLPKASQ
jgi:hypothetical protein